MSGIFSFALYPNPNAGTFYLQATAGRYIITNCFGQVVTTIVVPSPATLRVETTALPNGVYFVTKGMNPKSNVRMLVQH